MTVVPRGLARPGDEDGQPATAAHFRLAGVYWGMRLPPLLLASALVACASPGKPAPLETVAPAATPGSGLAPASFVRTTADAPAMRSIDVRDGLSRQMAMRTLTDALSQRYVVDVVDPRAGFAMTTWQARYRATAYPTRAIERASSPASSTTGRRCRSAPRPALHAVMSPTSGTTRRSSTRWPSSCAPNSDGSP